MTNPLWGIWPSNWGQLASFCRFTGIITAALLTACGGEPETDSSSATTSSVISSSSSAQSSSSSSGSSYADFAANLSISNGASNYQAQCLACHGERGEGLTENKVNAIRLDNYPDNSGLFDYIVSFMPKSGGNTGPADCVGQCAADITAYLDSLRIVTASCNAEHPVIYGERSIKLLTEREYANSVQDLFPGANVPTEFLESLEDIHIGRFPNHSDAAVISARARKFMSNAEGIADWAITTNQFGSCNNATTCAQSFIEDFAFHAFRRPLKNGSAADDNEVAHYQNLFAQAPTPSAGLRWAIIATLTSPNFLYRSELGVPVREAQNDPLFSPVGSGSIIADIDQFEALPGGETYNGTQFTINPGGNGQERERDGVQTHLLWTNGSASRTFTFTSPAILTLNLGGNDYNNSWPLVSISVGGELIAAESIDTTDYGMRSYQYALTGITGNQTVSIEFSNDGSDGQDGQPGHDTDLYIGDITVSPAQLKGGEGEEKPALELADPDAYVLDPYEYASALSYFLIGSTPDAQLLNAAQSGALNTEEGVQEQVARLLESDRAEENIKQFVVTWMRVQRMYDSNFLRNADGFNDAIRDNMVEELKTFFWYIFDNETVPFEEFYTADYTFLNAALANFYGLNLGNGVTAPNGFVKSDTPNRGGITTMGAFLTTWAHPDETSPILRAVNVREQMLCHHIDPPPKTAIDAESRRAQTEKVNQLQLNNMMTTRMYYEIITDHPDCASCHQYDINPLGGGLEDFDNVGRPRTMQFDRNLYDDLLSVSFDGMLYGVEQYKDTADTLAFSGAEALGDILGATEAVQACLAEKAFRLALGRPIKNTARDKLTNERELTANEAQDYACAQEQLTNTLKNSNQSPKEMFKTLGTLDLLRFRR